MTFKDKLKHMLHPSGHKKSPSSSTSNFGAPSPAPASQTSYIPDPNKPPNARDPGFRKSFNLGESPPATASVEPTQTSPEQTQSLPINGKSKMYTLDKYGDDYLAVSPRTNATNPESPINRGLSTVSALEEDGKAGLGTIQESKRNDPVSSATKQLEGLSTSQQNPDFGRDQFAQGDRKVNGNIEPVPTRDPTINNTSPKPQHPTSFALESTPEVPPITPGMESPNTTKLTRQSTETKPTGLLSPPIITEDASSIYSDDSAAHPTLQRFATGSSYNHMPPSSPPLDPGTSLTASNLQREYAPLVSDALLGPQEANEKTVEENSRSSPLPDGGDYLTALKSNFPDSKREGIRTPSSVLEERKDFMVSQGIPDTSEPGQREFVTEKEIPVAPAVSTQGDEMTTHENSKSTAPAQQDEVADTITSTYGHIPSKSDKDVEESNQSSAIGEVSPGDKPITTTTNTVPHADASHMGDKLAVDAMEKKGMLTEEQRPPLQQADSVLEVTKAIPGAF